MQYVILLCYFCGIMYNGQMFEKSNFPIHVLRDVFNFKRDILHFTALNLMLAFCDIVPIRLHGNMKLRR